MVRGSFIAAVFALIVSVSTAVFVFARDDDAGRVADNSSGGTITASETLGDEAVEAQTPWPTAEPTPLLWARAATEIAGSTAAAASSTIADATATPAPMQAQDTPPPPVNPPPALPSPTAPPISA